MELKPCPFCGNELPWTHISFNTAVLECGCGATFRGGSAAVKTLYKRDEVPENLRPYVYEPDLLTIIKDGKEVGYPEHGYVGVNVVAAFWFSGITEKWNRRV